MKLIAVALATAAVTAAGTHAYSSNTPAQIAALQVRVAKLESFNQTCLKRYRVHLTEDANGTMVWGYGPASPHAARFYAIPDTVAAPLLCG